VKRLLRVLLHVEDNVLDDELMARAESGL